MTNYMLPCTWKSNLGYKGFASRVYMDLLSDWEKQNEKYLSDNGIMRKDSNTASFDFFRFQRRIILPKPRKIKVAREFSCPKDYESTLERLKRRIRNGDNINHYLSRRILDLNKNDGLLDDWGIYHFHLSDTVLKNDPRFMDRSDWLLMAWVTDECVYFIKCVEHESPTEQVWVNDKWLEIVRDNWPELIEFSKVSDAVMENDILPMERYKARKKGILMPTKLSDGTVLTFPGGGYNSCGSSLMACKAYNHYYNNLAEVEVLLREYFPSIMIDSSGIDYPCYCFKLIKYEDNIWIFEKNMKMFVCVYQDDGKWALDCY